MKAKASRVPIVVVGAGLGVVRGTIRVAVYTSAYLELNAKL
jgi:hypothetical protein